MMHFVRHNDEEIFVRNDGTIIRYAHEMWWERDDKPDGSSEWVEAPLARHNLYHIMRGDHYRNLYMESLKCKST